jgi:hypothetical protein
MEYEKLKNFWHPKNDTQLEDYKKSSTKKVWWQCLEFPEDEWEMSIVHMRARKGCPFCAGRRVNSRNCLATKEPKVLTIWDYEKNLITPDEISSRSSKKVWWKCEYNHSWSATVFQVTKGHGCPYCCNQKINKENCLATTHYYLVKELVDKSIAYQYSYGTQKKVLWKCDKHGEYWSSISNRARSNAGCNKCAIEYRAENKKIGALNKAYNQFISACNKMKRKNNLTFNKWKTLVLSDCFYCGITSDKGRKIYPYNIKINGIDRVDNNIDYINGNIVSCCWMCNKMKGTLSKKDFLFQAEQIAR